MPLDPLNGTGTARSSRPPSGLVLVGTGCLALAGLGLGWAYDASGGGIAIPCPLRLTTGLECPLCGTTRMIAALLHADVGAAARYNPFALALGIGLGYLWLSWVLERFGLARLPRPRLGPIGLRRAWAGLAAVALVFMVVRNLVPG